MPKQPTAPASAALSRRAVVVGAGVTGAGLVVAGCSTVETSGDASGAGAEGTPADSTLGPSSDVPVGSARIYEAEGVVVTQATAGDFAAFSTACPHQGCAVARIEGPSIICPCHGSSFALDGTVTQGPATTGLESRGVTVTGDQLTLT
jgi:Rieske Fe-S protein